MTDDPFDRPSHQPAAGRREVAHLWTLSLSGKQIEAKIFEHPLGVELRVLEEGMLRRAQVHRSTLDAYEDAKQTYERLLDRGAVRV